MRTLIRSFCDYDLYADDVKGQDRFVIVCRSTKKPICFSRDYDDAYRIAISKQEEANRSTRPQGYALIRLVRMDHFEVVRTTAKTKVGLIWIYDIRDVRNGGILESSKSYSRIYQQAVRMALKEVPA